MNRKHGEEASAPGEAHDHTGMSDHKLSRQQMQLTETSLTAILNASPETIFLMTVDGTILAANQSMAKRMKMPIGEVVGRSVYSHLSPTVAEARRQQVALVVATGQAHSFTDTILDLTTEHYLYPILGPDGKVSQIAVFALDISKRIKAEQALIHSQSLLNATQALNHSGGWQWDVANRTMEWTAETYRIHGVSPQEMPVDSEQYIAKSLACYDPADQPVILGAFQRCIEQGESYDLEVPFTSHDGRRLWVRTIGVPIWKNQHYSLTHAGIWADCIRQAKPIIHNDYATMTGRQGLPAGHAHLVRELVTPVVRDGQVVAVMGVGNKEQPYDEKDLQLVTTLANLAWDLILRKRAEEDLVASEQRYRDLFEANQDGITVFRLDQNGNPGPILDMNEAAAAMLGHRKEDLLGKNVTNFEKAFNPSKVTARLAEIAAEGQIRFETILVDRLGNDIPVEIHVRQILYQNQPALMNITRNISKRRQAQQALRDSEEMFRLTFDRSPVAAALVDQNFRFIRINAAFHHLIGYSEQDLLQRTFVDITHPDHCHDDLSQAKALLAGQIDRYETQKRYIHKDGHIIWARVCLALVRRPDGSPQFFLPIIQDITATKAAEEALRLSLAEKEVLLREVHHRVKNNMAAIIGLFELQRQAMDDPLARTVLTELSCRVRAMSLIHEKLYRSESLSQIDFQDYIQSLISHLRTSFGSPAIRCEIAASEVNMPLDLAVPCGMIINELVTNALKYAFPAETDCEQGQPCRITVTLFHHEGVFTLTVADNGVGLPPAFDWTTAKTMGLILVRMLGQHQLGGHYELDQTIGTRFTLTFSVRNERKNHD